MPIDLENELSSIITVMSINKDDNCDKWRVHITAPLGSNGKYGINFYCMEEDAKRVRVGDMYAVKNRDIDSLQYINKERTEALVMHIDELLVDKIVVGGVKND